MNTYPLGKQQIKALYMLFTNVMNLPKTSNYGEQHNRLLTLEKRGLIERKTFKEQGFYVPFHYVERFDLSEAGCAELRKSDGGRRILAMRAEHTALRNRIMMKYEADVEAGNIKLAVRPDSQTK